MGTAGDAHMDSSQSTIGYEIQQRGIGYEILQPRHGMRPQLFHSFSTAFPQLFHRLGTRRRVCAHNDLGAFRYPILKVFHRPYYYKSLFSVQGHQTPEKNV